MRFFQSKLWGKFVITVALLITKSNLNWVRSELGLKTDWEHLVLRIGVWISI